MQCSRCGQVNAGAAQFCIQCGLALATAFAPTEGISPAAISEGNAAQMDVPTPSPAPAYSAGPFNTPSAIPFQAPLPLSPSGVPAPVSQPSVPPRRPGATDWGAMRAQAALTFACRLCGGPVPGSLTACPLCDAPHGMIANPNDGTGATYLVAGTLYPPPTDSIEALTRRPLPAAVAAMRWNWGAFGASTPWLLAHPRLLGWGFISLLLMLLMPLAYFGPFYLLLPAAGVLVSLLAGFQGNALAWQFGSYPDVETFKRIERRWVGIGILSAIGKTVVLTLLILLAIAHK